MKNNSVQRSISHTALDPAIYAVVSDRMWKKLPPDHPAVYREPVLEG